MQQAPNHLLSWLDHLRILMPPRHVTLVGAGNGSGPWVQWLLSRAVPSATLVEADDALIHPLQATVAAASGAWRVRKQVIGPETATVTFHVASVSSESGLLEPESLRSLWPNLKTRQKQTRQAITLDELLQDDEQGANWLIVDCWPALPLLQGGQQALAQMDVALVRTTMGADTPDTLNPSEVEAQLVAQGFRAIATDAGRHPGVGHALYVREPDANPQSKAALAHWQQEAERLAVREVELAEQVARLGTLLTEAQTSRDAHAARAVALEANNTQAQQALQQSVHATQALETQLQDTAHALAQRTDELAKAQAALEAATAHAKELEQDKAQAEQALQQSGRANQALETELQDTAQTLAQRTDELAKAKAALETATAHAKDLEKAKTQAEQAVQHSSQQIQQLLAREQALGEETTRLTAALNLAQQQLALMEQGHEKAMSTLQATCSAIEKELANQQAGLTKALAAELSQQLQQQTAVIAAKQQESSKEIESRSRTHIDKALANAVKQLEAFQAIQGFLTTGETISNFHGWPISPDIGLFLLEKLQRNRYDLIIEFGSGTSTLLFAKALRAQERQANSIRSQPEHATTKRVLTFEHDLKYLTCTRELLVANGVDSVVDLVHAPLVDWTDETGTYLYYDCGVALQKAAESLGLERAKILVLVDGPPGVTCKNARYPAIPQVFNRLARHHIDVVLDDANRPEEKASIELWRQLWKKRNARVEESLIPSEKGIYQALC